MRHPSQLLLTGLLGLAFLVPKLSLHAEDSIRVTVNGTLRTGIVAIGGETTGTTITANGITWELDLGKNAEFRAAATKLNGKKATVQGTLQRRRGVEIKERWIVTVTSLKSAAGREEKDTPGLSATPGRTDTRLQFESSADQTVIDIKSGTGIDKATVRRTAERWPTKLVVRLHLSGLELFQVGADELTLKWSVASSGTHAATVSLRKENGERPLGKDSPYFSPVRIVGGNGKVPLEGGYFEVALPSKLLEGNPKEIGLRWIDFYRN